MKSRNAAETSHCMGKCPTAASEDTMPKHVVSAETRIASKEDITYHVNKSLDQGVISSILHFAFMEHCINRQKGNACTCSMVMR